MKILVTGVAGFIGSSLAEAILARGDEVIGVDCFIDPATRWIKENNLQNFRQHPRFTLIQADLLQVDPAVLIRGVDAVSHQAGFAGVHRIWGLSFADSLNNNVLTTQRLLEACKVIPVKKFVYASSSSVYGDAPARPTREDALPDPLSPYAVSKLAGEQLCMLYSKNFAVPTVSLRYFTVYGPRQRPDMAFHKFIKAALAGQPLIVYGNGQQIRDFTYIDDVVRATMAALDCAGSGLVLNIGGGSQVNINQVIAMIAEITHRSLDIRYQDKKKGEPFCTCADTGAAAMYLSWLPQMDLKEGLTREIEYISTVYGL